MKLIFGILSLATAALAGGRTSPPSPSCLTVGKSGAQHTTIQAAVNALPASSTTALCIFINPGTYDEQVLVPPLPVPLSMYGYTTDTSTYKSNTVTITASKSQADGLSNDETATLRVKETNFKLYNVNVNNGHGKGSQAVALSAYADSGYYACQFTGYQDTLLSQQGYQIYAKCLIQGATDFIFGQTAMAWFEKCDIRVLAASVGYVTANGRSSSTNPSYYVFNDCNVAAASGNSVAAGAYYLGRPWGDYARVVFQKSTLSEVINSAGWHIWNTGDERTDHVTFGEYENNGAGASGQRAAFATKLGSAVKIDTVLTSGYVVRSYYDKSYF